jgi:hypothetical protein
MQGFKRSHNFITCFIKINFNITLQLGLNITSFLKISYRKCCVSFLPMRVVVHVGGVTPCLQTAATNWNAVPGSERAWRSKVE